MIGGNCEFEQAAATSSVAVTDPYCVKAQGTACLECSKGYFYSSANSKCEQLDPTCKTHDLKTGYCLTCYTGFVLLRNKCETPTVVVIPNCLVTSAAGFCASCI